VTADRDSAGTELLLYYDKQCPVCDRYCRALGSTEQGALRLIDARSNPSILRDMTDRGIDIDQNMVLKIDDEYYIGAEAINKMALLTTGASCFDRLNRALFRSRRRARMLYPVLRLGRNVLLKLLGRTKINNLGLPNNERF
jgi:predicted DCC family thiol-disulfide oxidoreductase YuxK